MFSTDHFTHPQWLGIWAFYFLAQILHLLWAGWLAARSKANLLTGVLDFLKLRAVPIVCRLFLTTLTFMLLWYPLIGAITVVFKSFMQIAALAGIFGWASDSLWDKLVATLGQVLPAFQREKLPSLDGKDDPPAGNG